MSGSGNTHASVDPLRKSVIVAVLVAALIGLHHFATPQGDFDPTGMLALGFVVLCSYTFGQLVDVIKLPHITGYLIAGVLLGPSVAEALPNAWRIPPFDHGVLNHHVYDQLKLFNTLAFGLIALTAGGELKVDALRKGFRAIMGVLIGQTLTTFAAVIGFVWLISGSISFIALEPLAGLGTMGALAVGTVMASIALATSPAATIAVVNETGSSGPMTQTVMSAVVLKDVVVVILFSVTSALAGMVLGASAIDQPLWSYLLVHIVGSLFAGAALAGVLAAYIRYVGNETLLFLVALIYLGSYTAQSLHLDPVLMFIAAGFVASNFTSQGETLIHSVEQLSLPVYVVFFTLAGAHLDLDAVRAMAPFAVALVLVRVGAYWAGVTLGATLAGADENTKKYGWMGFASQAGVAIALASMVRKTYGDLGGEDGGPSVGEALETLLIAGVAINELIGPVMLKIGLGLANETGANFPAEEELPPDPLTEEELAQRLAPWEPPVPIANPWGPPPATESAELNNLALDVEHELQGLVRDLVHGPLEDFKTNSQSYLQNLRREFLRHHRRALVQSGGIDDRKGIPALLRNEETELARRWRAIVLDRAATIPQKSWRAHKLVDVLDQLADSLPETVESPWEAVSFERRDDESPLLALQRAGLHTRARLNRMGGGRLAPRVVHVRALGRYHFSGALPARLEAIAALLVTAEAHLAARTRSIFDGISSGYDQIAPRTRAPDADIEALLWAVRTEVEEEFTLAVEELDRVVLDGSIRAARILGESIQAFKADLPISDTLDLPARSRRFSLVYNSRATGTTQLTTGLEVANRTTSARYTVLALELELVGLEGQIKEAVDQHGSQLARIVRGRGPKQLARVEQSLSETLATLEAHLSTEATGTELALRIRTDAEPLARVVAEANREALRLRDHLVNEESIGPLVDALLSASQTLTERYTVPTGRALTGEWKLPTAVTTAEVPFREVVIAYIESSVTRNLSDLSRELMDEVQRLVNVFEELERIVAFNVELAGAELEVLQSEQVTVETAELVREMVVGALLRSRARVLQHKEQVDHLPNRARKGVRIAVMEDLEQLRARVVDGRVAELRMRLLREAASARSLARDAEQFRGFVQQTSHTVLSFTRQALGEDRLALARQALGVPDESMADPSPRTFERPEVGTGLPVVYKRLFSDQALEAGDLLTGRQAEIHRARAVLTGTQGGRYRAAAIVGFQGVGKGAFVNALVRAFKTAKVRRIVLEGPATVEEVASWFEGDTDGQLVVIRGFEYLYRLGPHGFAPLRRLADGIVADDGRNAWVLSASHLGWETACRAVPLEDAFPEVIRLRPLDVEELASAVLARHSMSGYGLAFDAQDDLGFQVQHLLSRASDQEERRRSAWFQTLHAATGGVVSDALSTWMASIRKVDEIEGLVRVGPVPRPPIAALRALPERTLLTLRVAHSQGWIDVELHSELFNERASNSNAHLAHLAHLGLLRPTEPGRWRITPHLLAPIAQVLNEQGWSP